MPTITVHGVPEGLLLGLRRGADANGRNLSRHVIVLLARSVGRAAGGPCAETAVGAGCIARGCVCAARRVSSRVVGWGGPALPGAARGEGN